MVAGFYVIRGREREFIIGDVVIIQTHSRVNTAILGQKFTIHTLRYTVEILAIHYEFCFVFDNNMMVRYFILMKFR